MRNTYARARPRYEPRCRRKSAVTAETLRPEMGERGGYCIGGSTPLPLPFSGRHRLSHSLESDKGEVKRRYASVLRTILKGHLDDGNVEGAGVGTFYARSPRHGRARLSAAIPLPAQSPVPFAAPPSRYQAPPSTAMRHRLVKKSKSANGQSSAAFWGTRHRRIPPPAGSHKRGEDCQFPLRRARA